MLPPKQMKSYGQFYHKLSYMYCKTSLYGVLIIIFQWPSYMYRVNNSGVISYRGTAMELVVAAAQMLNFRYDIHLFLNR